MAVVVHPQEGHAQSQRIGTCPQRSAIFQPDKFGTCEHCGRMSRRERIAGGRIWSPLADGVLDCVHDEAHAEKGVGGGQRAVTKGVAGGNSCQPQSQMNGHGNILQVVVGMDETALAQIGHSVAHASVHFLPSAVAKSPCSRRDQRNGQGQTKRTQGANIPTDESGGRSLPAAVGSGNGQSCNKLSRRRSQTMQTGWRERKKGCSKENGSSLLSKLHRNKTFTVRLTPEASTNENGTTGDIQKRRRSLSSLTSEAQAFALPIDSKISNTVSPRPYRYNVNNPATCPLPSRGWDTFTELHDYNRTTRTFLCRFAF